MGESMSRERELDTNPFERIWAELSQYDRDELWPHIDAAKKVCTLAHAAGEHFGREDSDSVYWPALCEQWRIEFGKEFGREGGHIMNIVDGVRELLRAEREECSRLICNQCASSIPIENDKYHYSICMHPGARIERFNYRPCPAAAIRARGVAQEEGQ